MNRTSWSVTTCLVVAAAAVIAAGARPAPPHARESAGAPHGATSISKVPAAVLDRTRAVDARSDGAPSTAVDLSHLPRGAGPRLAYFDRRTALIHDGASSVRVRFPGEVVRLERVPGGYLVEHDSQGSGSMIRFVSHAGRTRVLAHGAADSLQAVSSDRRTLAYLEGRRQRRVVVVRIGDAHVLAQRVIHRDAVRVVAVDRRRALVAAGRRTYWWDFAADTLRVYADDPAVGADLAARRVVLSWGRSYRYYVGSLPRGSRPSWWGPGSERPTQVSPDGRTLLSLDPYPRPADTHVDHGFSRLFLRAQRDGAARRSFAGHFDDAQGPRWETPRTFLLVAGAPAGENRVTWVRCSVDGPCETVGPAFTLDPGRRSYGAPWVLAASAGPRDQTSTSGW